MTKYKILCLTEHAGHSIQNSLYSIIKAMSAHHRSLEIFVASRSDNRNRPFFEDHDFGSLFALKANQHFNFESSRIDFIENTVRINPADFDLLFLRLPRPTSDEFLTNLERTFSSKCFVNKPSGIIECSNKASLLNFKEVCPPMELCHSIEAVLAFAGKYDMVLKPLKEYGGKGLLRIKDGLLNDGTQDYKIIEYLELIENEIISNGYLAMKYLKNVNQGDKRLIVVNGEILAASLRLPAPESWLCNVAMGGKSIKSAADPIEQEIINHINPFLLERGILIYGADTLVDDNGNRILSEINALSIGGFPQAEKQTGKPIINITLDKIFDYADAHYAN